MTTFDLGALPAPALSPILRADLVQQLEFVRRVMTEVGYRSLPIQVTPKQGRTA